MTHTHHKNLGDSFKEVITSLLPIMAIITFLMLLLTFGGLVGFKMPDGAKLPDGVNTLSDLWVSFIGGTVLVICGMSLFLYGSGISMMNIGKKTGSFLVNKGKLWLILFFGFFLGYLVTNAEPDLLVLSRQVASVNPAIHKTVLISIISVGTGFFLSLALFRVMKSIHLVKVLLTSYCIVFGMAFVAMFFAPDMVALSFDSSGVTTGPVTVPFILSFAAGVSKMVKGNQESDASFGMVGITSIGAILAVLCMSIYFR